MRENLVGTLACWLSLAMLLCGSAMAQSSSSDVSRGFQENVQDVYFQLDRAELSADSRASLAKTADWLKANPGVVITVSGATDDRGDVVYNLALSQRRADAVRDALLQSGVSSGQILFATGWGELYPVCGQPDEACWNQNRRAHLDVWPESLTWLANAATNYNAAASVR